MAIITKPMLAPNEIPGVGDIVFPVLATPKVDGIRCLRIDGRSVSRKFLDIPNLHVQKVLNSLNLPDNIDGELFLPGKTFNQVQSAIMREEGEPDFVYYVFDYVSSSLTEPYSDRMKKLEKLSLPAPCIKLLPKVIHNMEELAAYEAECLAMGFEGCMLRPASSPYKCGRSTLKQGWLLKLKSFVDSEAEVVGFVEQMHNTNEAEEDAFGRTKRSKAQEGLVPAGTLGKLIVREIGDLPWKGKEFGVGTGFNAAERQEIWDNQSEYLGKIITYKFQGHGVKDLPRIPVWKGFRSDKDMSK